LCMNNTIYLKYTKKLIDQIKLKKVNSIVSYSPSIFTWHAGFNFINHRKCILFMNDLTRFSVFLYGVKKKELDNLEQVFINSLQETLESENFNKAEISQIMQENQKIEITKTNNRSVLGCMNDFWRIIPYCLFESSMDYLNYAKSFNLTALSKTLNKTPMMCSKKGIFPIKEMKNTLEIRT
jgi:uncharacterized protein DUF6933